MSMLANISSVALVNLQISHWPSYELMSLYEGKK